MKRLILAMVLALGASQLAAAQTISPIIQEYTEKADGRFQLYNDAAVPLTVVLEPHSFSVDASGTATFRKLDPEIHVQLSATSFRLAPKQTYFVFYKATAETLPAWFCIYATVTGTTTSTGIKLALELPHTVYLLNRKEAAQNEVVVLKAAASEKDGKKLIAGEIENHSTEFTRIQEVEVSSPAGKQVFPGFALFPAQKRDFDFDWDEPGTPEQIVLKFQHFKVESKIAPATP